MSIKQKTALSGLNIALAFVFGCGPTGRVSEPGPGKHHGREDNRSFRIYIYADPTRTDQCLVDWPQATLWKDKNHTAKWVSDDGAAYIVDFTLGKNGSPFSQKTFPVPAGDEVPSGQLNQTSSGYYGYGIKGANNKVCRPSSEPGASDPGIYVD